MSLELDRKLLIEAMERLGRTPDGRVLYMHLQTILLAIDPLPNSPDQSGALRENFGRRLLAQQLRELMAPGVLAIDPKVDERPTIFKRAEPVRLADRQQHGAARRVRPIDADAKPADE